MKQKLIFEEPALAVMNFIVEEVTVSIPDKPGVELPDDEFPF